MIRLALAFALLPAGLAAQDWRFEQRFGSDSHQASGTVQDMGDMGRDYWFTSEAYVQGGSTVAPTCAPGERVTADVFFGTDFAPFWDTHFIFDIVSDGAGGHRVAYPAVYHSTLTPMGELIASYHSDTGAGLVLDSYDCTPGVGAEISISYAGIVAQEAAGPGAAQAELKGSASGVVTFIHESEW